MSKPYCEEIADLICSVARREDAELVKMSNKGIMRCPELAFVYSVAKELSLRSYQIFGQLDITDKIDWYLEKSDKQKNIERLDLYIDPKLPPPNNGIIPVMFKLGYEVSGWNEDVEKLHNIENVTILSRIFCLLLTAPIGQDPRENKKIINFEQGSKINNLHRIGDFDSFRTLIDGKEKQCIIGIWEVVK